MGYPEHTIHTGPLIRRESVYKNDLREQRKALFNVLYHFTRLLDIQYICPVINQGDCAEKSKLAYTDKLTKEILDDVIKKFKNYKAAEIVNYMHEERAYKETTNGAIIPFSLAKEIRNF